jgi:hypothetical protein
MAGDRDDRTVRVRVVEQVPREGPLSAAERARRYRARKRGQDVPKEKPGPKRYTPPAPPVPASSVRAFVPPPRKTLRRRNVEHEWQLSDAELAALKQDQARQELARNRRGVAAQPLRAALRMLEQLRPGDLDDDLVTLLGDLVAAAEDLRTRHELAGES